MSAIVASQRRATIFERYIAASSQGVFIVMSGIMLRRCVATGYAPRG
jgi:hypothetical protein